MLATLLFLWRRHRRRPVNGLDGSYEADDVSVESSALESDAQMPFQGVVEMLMAQAPPLLSPRAVPGGLNSCPWTFVELPEQLEVLAEQLGQLQRFALDVEHHGTHSYFGATCLLQISTGSQEYVIDALALHSSLGHTLGPIFSNPDICKVVHGGGNDVMWLQRDFGIFLVNCFDTEKACQVLGFQQRSLAWLLQRYCSVDANKSLQQADWRQRPLPEELLHYARTDVHYLLYIADCLGEELAQRDAPLEAQQAQQAQQAGGAAPPASPAEGSPEEDNGHGSSSGLGTAAAAGRNASGKAAAVAAAAAAGAAAPNTLKPGSKLWHAVQRSQGITLSLYRAPTPRAAAESAALAVMRRHVAELRGRMGQLQRPESFGASQGASQGMSHGSQGVSKAESSLSGLAALNAQERREVEAVGDAVFALCEWRDAAARDLDEGIQCVLPDALLLQLACAPPLTPQALHQAVEASRAPSSLLPPSSPTLEAALAHPLPSKEAPGATLGGPDAAVLPPAAAAAIPAAPAAAPCACFPGALLGDAPVVVELLREAVAGQRPWVSAELNALVQPGGQVASSAKKKHQDPAAFRERLAKRFSAKRAVYENCIMLSLEGEVLCHTDRRKLEWYLSKGIADKVSDDPLTVRLRFQHKTTDQARGTSEYYQAVKQNKCVACGEEGHYLRYRVVPSCYRRAMPVHLKSHRSHDVVLLCISCHEVAHGAAEKVKRRLAEEYNVPLFPPLSATYVPYAGADATAGRSAALEAGDGNEGAGSQELASFAAEQQQEQQEQQQQQWQEGSGGGAASLHPYHVRQAALALDRHGRSMPAERRRGMEAQILSYLGRSTEAAAHSEPNGTDPIPPLQEVASQFTDADLVRGLLAGVSSRTRRKLLRSWRAKGRALPPDLAAEAAALAGEEPSAEAGASSEPADADADAGTAGSEGSAESGSAAGVAQGSRSGRGGGSGGSASSKRAVDSAGHVWHGQQVVERIRQHGGGDEGLLQLCQRFRQCFVEALRPQYLPPGWRVEHSAARDFGEFSIYRSVAK